MITDELRVSATLVAVSRSAHHTRFATPLPPPPPSPHQT